MLPDPVSHRSRACSCRPRCHRVRNHFAGVLRHPRSHHAYRQGADVGPQYASAIFCQTEQQKEIAQKVISQVEAETGERVVTRLLGAEHFWPAEDYHRNYYLRNPNQGYCQAVISPKLAKFRKRYIALLSA